MHGLRRWTPPSVKEEWLAIFMGIQDFFKVAIRLDNIQFQISLLVSLVFTGVRRKPSS